MMSVKVSRMDRAQQSGDWHDAPLRWQVVGPADELQKFSTRDSARLYARIRRGSATARIAEAAYVRS